jgi:hypothetical protein
MYALSVAVSAKHAFVHRVSVKATICVFFSQHILPLQNRGHNSYETECDTTKEHEIGDRWVNLGCVDIF